MKHSVFLLFTGDNEANEEKECEIELELEPAQNGGLTDPSWDARYSIESITCGGEDVTDAFDESYIDDVVIGLLEE